MAVKTNVLLLLLHILLAWGVAPILAAPVPAQGSTDHSVLPASSPSPSTHASIEEESHTEARRAQGVRDLSVEVVPTHSTKQTPLLEERKSPSYNRNGKKDMRQTRPKPTHINTNGNADFRTYYLNHDTHTSQCGSAVCCVCKRVLKRLMGWQEDELLAGVVETRALKEREELPVNAAQTSALEKREGELTGDVARTPALEKRKEELTEDVAQMPVLEKRKTWSYNRNGKGDMRQQKTTPSGKTAPRVNPNNPNGNGAYRSFYLNNDTHGKHPCENVCYMARRVRRLFRRRQADSSN